MKTIGYIATILTILIVGALMNGWALSKLWLWFIVKTFGVSPLSIPAAIGFAMVVTYLTNKTESKKDERPYWRILTETGAIVILKPLFAVAFGAVIKLWL